MAVVRLELAYDLKTSVYKKEVFIKKTRTDICT